MKYSRHSIAFIAFKITIGKIDRNVCTHMHVVSQIFVLVALMPRSFFML